MDIAVSKDSSIPLHLQLLNSFRHLILSGEWSMGSRVPSEATLQSLLGISRSTIRQALTAAKAEGLVASVPGKGTFVTKNQTHKNNSRLVGFVIPYFRSSFDSQLLRGAESALRAKGYRVIFCNSERQLQEEDRLLHLLLQDRASGILIWPVMDEKPRRFLFDLVHQVPVSLIDRTFPGLEADVVLADNFNGAHAATHHLISLGHKKVIFMARPHLNLLPISERLRGYNRAMQDAGLEPFDPLLIGEQQEISTDYAMRSYTNASGQDIQQIRNYLCTPNRASAIFAMNDLMALQVLRAAELVNVSVPHELSVVGFDDMDFVSHLPVALTTVVQDSFALGQQAARLLLRRIDGDRTQPEKIILPTHLIIRESTSRPSDQRL